MLAQITQFSLKRWPLRGQPSDWCNNYLTFTNECTRPSIFSHSSSSNCRNPTIIQELIHDVEEDFEPYVKEN